MDPILGINTYDEIPWPKTIGSNTVGLIPWTNHKISHVRALFSAWKCMNFSLHESAWTFLCMKVRELCCTIIYHLRWVGCHQVQHMYHNANNLPLWTWWQQQPITLPLWHQGQRGGLPYSPWVPAENSERAPPLYMLCAEMLSAKRCSTRKNMTPYIISNLPIIKTHTYIHLPSKWEYTR